jgi:hypothetical protein
MLTVEDAKAWASERCSELDADRLGHEDQMVQMMNRMIPEKSKSLWDSGCWLAAKLREHGATDEQVSSIQMAQGQRAFGGDAWQAAVDYANEFAANGDTEEKGGAELAAKRHSEIFG